MYRLEIGEAGESCALHIAERLGMPAHLLLRAKEITYSGRNAALSISAEDNPANRDELTNRENAIMTVTPLEIKDEPKKEAPILRSQSFNIGDSVTVYPQKSIGIVYKQANENGEIGVQIKGQKQLINHKRIKLRVAASELYPEDYDFSIIFDTVENRKARHLMNRKYVRGNTVVVDEDML